MTLFMFRRLPTNHEMTHGLISTLHLSAWKMMPHLITCIDWLPGIRWVVVARWVGEGWDRERDCGNGFPHRRRNSGRDLLKISYGVIPLPLPSSDPGRVFFCRQVTGQSPFPSPLLTLGVIFFASDPSCDFFAEKVMGQSTCPSPLLSGILFNSKMCKFLVRRNQNP